MRSFFGEDAESSIMESALKIDPSRSPFMRGRMDVILEGEQLADLIEQVKKIELYGSSFKVMYVKVTGPDKVDFKERRRLEREVGLHISGEPELVNPDVLFGIMNANERWVFGEYHGSEAVWLNHQQKPHSYSTSLSTRVARAVANIAVPDPAGVKAIDPCCGIGTVVVEALSMGVDIVASDINPLILPGTRENIAHFGYATQVTFRDIRKVTGSYDVAIIDMPYNLCSVITPEEQLEMLQSTYEFADKVVIVTIEPIDSIIGNAGFEIADRCVVKKGNFTREVIVCEK
ncbi:RNA methyltransferase [Mesobacillus subterraneus]|uniref:TRM11 family SAM-dependent methyltransferase n=1 Tax=Mesobacillus subterraneus TaxID=285983 RepID=UPI001CFC5C1D|nr:RNA methyltransferase [Mesobacillus subterraneus]WLR57745.1 RNA methyltransferase [Mesobacillus subterraneus]